MVHRLDMRTRLTHWMLTLILTTLGVLGVSGISTLFAAPASAADSAAGGHWVWPVSGSIHVLRGFEPPSGPYAGGHRGVDLATSVGQSVRSAGSGVVTFAGDIGGTPILTITHGTLRTTYQPVLPSVHVGEPVLVGEAVGAITIAPTHCGLLPSCLHWGLLRGSTYLDPLSLVGASSVRLLPHLQLGPPSSGVVTLATGSPQGVTEQAATSLPAAERVRTTDANAFQQQSAAATSKPPRALLAGTGAVMGAALAIVTAVRRRRGRWL